MTDLNLLKLLMRARRFDVATLQALRSEPDLDAALIGRGLMAPDELAAFRAELRTGVAAGLGQIGDYRLTARLGQGGMGAVYAGEHLRTGVVHAIKVATSLTGDSAERFRREGEAQARVDAHPNVLRVLGAGVSGNKHYLVMDLAPGGDLKDRLEQGPLPLEEAIEVVAALAEGLAFVHGFGILHRDVKPANVLFTADGRPCLTDFGLARFVDAETLTRTHALLGTPAYMAPEQLRSTRSVDVRTDVYALGAVLYECLTGCYLFTGSSGVQVLAQVATAAPRPPRELRAEVPAWLEGVCLKALSKDPDERFQSAEAFALALREQQRVRLGPGVKPSRLLAVAALAVVLVAALAGLAFHLTSAQADAQAASSKRAAVAEVATEVYAGLRAPGALAADQARVVALRGRWAELETTGDHARRVEAELLTWEGLVALARGDEAAAREAVRGLDALSKHQEDDASTARLIQATVLRAVLNDADPGEQLSVLLRAQAACPRPEFTRWADVARVRVCVAALQAGDADVVPLHLPLLVSAEHVPTDVRERAIAACTRRIRAGLGAIERDPHQDKKLLGANYGSVLSLQAWLGGALTPAEFEALFSYSTDPLRKVWWLAPILASFVPERYEIQERTALHWKLLSGLTAQGLQHQLATRYRPSFEAAHRLRPEEARRRLGGVFCEVLRRGRATEACLAQCAQLLASDALTPSGNARVLLTRAKLKEDLGDAQGALEDIDASLALASSRFANLRRAQLRLTVYRKKEAEASLRAALRFLKAVEPSSAMSGHEERLAYEGAVELSWEALRLTKKRPQDYQRGLEAIQELLRYYPGWKTVHWRVRAAYLQIRIVPADPGLALAELKRCLPLMAKAPWLVDLAPSARKTIAALAKDGKKARGAFLRLLLTPLRQRWSRRPSVFR